MKIVTLNGRGALVADPEALVSRLSGAKIVGLAEASKMTVLDIRHSIKTPAAKAARDWLIMGKGFARFSQLAVPCPHTEAGFSAGEVRKAFMAGQQRPGKVKGLKMVGGIFDSTVGWKNLK